MLEYQPISTEIWKKKYQLKDKYGNEIDATMEDTLCRVASTLANQEDNFPYWEKEFLWALHNGAIPAGRILSNAGAEEHKPATSLINCTVSQIVEDSIEGIMGACTNSAITLASGAGIGYEASTLRPKGAFVGGSGSYTSGPLTFMDIFDSMCFTISSAGGRRGAQMMTFAVWHPDVLEFIKAKREDGRLRQFNLSLLIDNEFMEAVKQDKDWSLIFPVMEKEVGEFSTVEKDLFWDEDYCKKMSYVVKDGKILCKIYKTIKAKDLWDNIMRSTYDFAEPGFLLIDAINGYNNNYWCENIRATNPCGEQPLPPFGSCLLGSINLVKFVKNPLTDGTLFDFDKFRKVVKIFTRMLDNVVEINGLPLEGQRNEILSKRRHGMGITGLGSALSLMGIKYGSKESVDLTDKIMKEMAIEGFKQGIELSKEKGPAPVLASIENREKWAKSKYMQRIWEVWPEGMEMAVAHGCRFTHHTSIAPTGTISLSYGNNISNGIEPSFSHEYTRNVIQEGKKSKSAERVFSYEGLLWKSKFGEDASFPPYYLTTDDIDPNSHVDIQAAAQYWCDSSISKTINVPTDYPFEKFKDIYIYAYESELKGCTTFRFNPEAFQGVLVKDDDLSGTIYQFTLEDGTVVEAKGNDTILYDGEEHSAANLYDAIKENYYGRF